VLATFLARWRPGAPSLDQGVRELIRFGAGLSISNIFNYISRNADNFLIARFVGQAQLGLYDRGYKLMMMPLQQVNAPISRVLLPLLSRLQTDPVRYRSSYLSTITGLMAAVQPGLLTAVIFAPAFVHVLLGPNWDAVVPIFVWLGLAGLHQITTNTLGWLLVSQGRARSLVVLGVCTSVTTVAAFVIGLRYGAVGVAAAYMISDYLLRLPVIWWYVTRNGPVSLSDLLRAAAPHAVAIAITGVVLLLVARIEPQPGFLGLALLAAAAYAIYGSVLVAFPDKRAMACIVWDKALALRRKRLKLA
jgi:PST family polysaccharide transporter